MNTQNELGIKPKETENKWEQVYENLKESNFFKPESGRTYAITFLDEGSDEYEDSINGKPVKVVDFIIEVDGKKCLWSVSTGGKKSRYGQMARCFKELGGSKGVTLHIKVDGNGQQRQYTIKEYTDIVFSEA